MALAMAGAAVAPGASSVLVRDEPGCSTSSRCGPCTPHSRLQLFLLPSSLPPPPRRRSSSSSSGRAPSITTPESRLYRSGLSLATSWRGRSHLGDIVGVFSGRQWHSRRGIAGRVHASLLGVGAPEALVIAVVALVVFGPKGLAEVARTLGKSLKAFQPTIQELQQVSREFRSTLEQEIGLDELRNPKPLDTPPTYQQPPAVQQQPRMQNGSPDARAYTAEDYMRVTEEQAKTLVPEELRREAEATAWGGSPPPKTPGEKVTTGAVSEPKKPEDES